MNILKLLRDAWNRPAARRATPRPRRRPALSLEALEDRAVPTVLFTPQRGAEHATTAGGSVMGTVPWGMPIYTIFWGSYWNTPAGVTYSNNIENSLNSMFFSSPYLDGLHQYGVPNRAGVNGSGTVRVFNYSNPNPSGFSGTDVFNVMANGIHSQGLPHPNDFTNHGVYFVITQPGAFQAGSGAGGYHTYGTVDGQRAEWGWIGTNGTMDNATYILSHETAETMSDPHGDAWQVDPRGGSGWNEICDNEAQNYAYRINGYWMQAYWSQSALAYQITDGNSQNFVVNNRQLIVNGDQLAGHDDNITVDAAGGGVRVTLNGQVAQFDPGQISSVVVNSLTGNNTVNVLQTLAGVPVTVNSGGSGNDVVNVGSGNSLAGIQGTLTLNDGPSYAHVNINDFADNATHTNVVLSSSGLTGLAPAAINFGPVSLDGLTISVGNGNNTYTVASTQGVGFAGGDPTTLNTGGGNDTVNVQSTASTAPLTVNGGGTGADVVNVGSGNSLAGIQGTLTLNNGPSYSHVNILDGADNAAHTNVVLSSSGLTGLAPAAINFGPVSLDGLTISVGNGNNTYTVASTQGVGFAGGDPTTLNTGGGNDTVNVQSTAPTAPLTVNGGGTGADVLNVGNANSLSGITGAVTINNGPSYFHVNVNDGSDNANHAVALSATSLTGLAPAAINFGSASVNTLAITVGNGNDTYSITGTPAYQGTTLSTGTGTNTVTVLGTNGPTTLTGNAAGVNTLVGPNATTTWNITGANAGNFSSTVASATFTNYRNLTGGSGNDTFVFSDGASLAGTLNGGGGVNTLNLSASTVATRTVNITGADAGNTPGATFTSIQNLTTGNGNDTFVYSNGASLAGTVNGGGGVNTVDLSASTANLTVNVTGNNAGNVAGVVGAFASVGNVTGGSGTNSFVFSDGASLSGTLNGGGGGNNTLDSSAYTTSETFAVTGANAGSGTPVGAFANVQNLTGGGAGGNTFAFADAATLTGTLNGGGGGNNTLDSSAYTTSETFAVTGADAGSGTPVGAFANVQNLTGGGAGGNTFAFADAATLSGTLNGGGSGNNTLDSSAYTTSESFAISGADAGSGTPAGAFTNVQNLTGAGAGGNYFGFADGASLGGNLAGGGGSTADYSAYTTSVTVDLQPTVASATGVGGSLSGITTVLGGSGAPGTAGLYNLLIGSDVVSDNLVGGTGRRNLLVAGGAAGTVTGGDGEDLLIGGSTTYDTQAGLANWAAIATYWAGGDPFAMRVTNVEGGIGVPNLDNTTVTGNGGGNTFNSGGGTGLIYTDNADTIGAAFAATTLYTIAP